MSSIRHIIQSQARDIGFTVRRLLPAAAQRSVGPFVFLDHMGPAHFAAGTTEGDVRPHPHIGLGTVTYLFSGAMMHRDSLGVVQRIEPGAVNWMSAGKGVVHSERMPADIRQSHTAVEGIQMWVALPLAEEESEPRFEHHPANTMPTWQANGCTWHLLIGQWDQRVSPLRLPSETFYAFGILDSAASFAFPGEVSERAIYVVSGTVEIDGQQIAAGALGVLQAGSDVTVRASESARVMLLGGAPLDAPRHMWWNFVSSSRERIEQAAVDWEAGRFALVPGEHERIPAPAFKPSHTSAKPVDYP